MDLHNAYGLQGRLSAYLAILLMALVSGSLPARAAGGVSPVNIRVGEKGQLDTIVRFAASELLAACQDVGAATVRVQLNDSSPKKGRIELDINPGAVKPAGGKAAAESFRITARPDGSVSILGTDARGVLWAVRDFSHYYAGDWIRSLRGAKPMTMDIRSSPGLQNRGLWSWWHGCYDPYAYVDRASEWKLNTITFWNRGVPLDAERLNAYAHDRGVKIWWGFSWGWTAGDFADASPPLAKRLLAIYERQKKEIGPELAVLCPYDPETPQALMDYVLDVYENQYAWIPNIDGIYFQTATEAVCPCSRCKAAPRGEGFVRTILPIIKEMHRRHPKLLISCGVHNTGDKDTFKALKQIPDYANICWESGVTWAPKRDIARDQMTYRGGNEDFAGVYRITMNCGLVLRGEDIRGETARAWLPRMDFLWNYLENGQPEGYGKGFKTVVLDGKEVGNPCTSDWRAPAGKRLIDNPNYQDLLTWSRDLANGPAATKGVFLLVEAGMLDLKMRRVPAMAAEVIWNPNQDEAELERRSAMIWKEKVGMWRDPVNPYWDLPLESASGGKVHELEDLGDIYRQMGREDSK